MECFYDVITQACYCIEIKDYEVVNILVERILQYT